LSIVACGFETPFLIEKVEHEKFIYVFADALQKDEKLQKNLTTGTNDKVVLYDTFSKVLSILQDNISK
jgi:hypothetical protein